jgi:hypothetical protein
MSEPRGRNSRPIDKHHCHFLANKLVFFLIQIEIRKDLEASFLWQ